MVHGNRLRYRHPRSHVPPMSWPMCRPFYLAPTPVYEPRYWHLNFRVRPATFQPTRSSHVPPVVEIGPVAFEIIDMRTCTAGNVYVTPSPLSLLSEVDESGRSQQILSFLLRISLTGRYSPWLNLHTSTRLHPRGSSAMAWPGHARVHERTMG